MQFLISSITLAVEFPSQAESCSLMNFSIFSAGDFKTKPDAKIVYESADGKKRKKLLFSGSKLIAGVIIGDGDGAADIIKNIERKATYSEFVK